MVKFPVRFQNGFTNERVSPVLFFRPHARLRGCESCDKGFVIERDA